MSEIREMITVPFKAKGTTYNLVFSRTLQLEYNKYMDEKRNDSEYQKEVAESERLKSRYETIHEQFLKAESEYFEDVLNEDNEKKYQKLEQLDTKAHSEYADYISTHSSTVSTVEFITYVMGKLIILGLQTQHKMTDKEAEELWNDYVAEVGDFSATKFLVYVASAWVGDNEEDENDPFIKAMEAKAERANNRRLGMNKIKK